MSRYFRLVDEVYIPGRWYLDEPLDEQGRGFVPGQFRLGVPFEPGRVLRLPVSQEGVALDFSLTGLASAVVSEAFVSLCEPMLGRDEVQFIPARVEGRDETCFILNTLRTVRCIDVARSRRVVLWEPRHGAPELVGHYRYVGGMVLDLTSIGDARMFRTWGWTMGLIVSELIQRAMVSAGLVGPRFEACEDGRPAGASG